MVTIGDVFRHVRARALYLVIVDFMLSVSQLISSVSYTYQSCSLLSLAV